MLVKAEFDFQSFICKIIINSLMDLDGQSKICGSRSFFERPIFLRGYKLFYFSTHRTDACKASCHPFVVAAHTNFSWVHFLVFVAGFFGARFCTWWHWGLFLGQHTRQLGFYDVLMWHRVKKNYFCICQSKLTAYWATTDQFFLDQRFLIGIKFDSDVWYFLTRIFK